MRLTIALLVLHVFIREASLSQPQILVKRRESVWPSLGDTTEHLFEDDEHRRPQILERLNGPIYWKDISPVEDPFPQPPIPISALNDGGATLRSFINKLYIEFEVDDLEDSDELTLRDINFAHPQAGRILGDDNIPYVLIWTFMNPDRIAWPTGDGQSRPWHTPVRPGVERRARHVNQNMREWLERMLDVVGEQGIGGRGEHCRYLGTLESSRRYFGFAYRIIWFPHNQGEGRRTARWNTE
ncbi:MAG: hypothetical protein M1831_005740 [Alyxoria varia]|nr:MAG: hypothetical protein M1831_005740 [Alyxoria varia]